MSIAKLPRWSWWVTGASIFWTAWVLILSRPLMQKIAELEGQLRGTESELTALEAQVSAVPELVLRLNGARRQLDSALAEFRTNREIDLLLRELRTSGGRNGVSGVRVDPELVSLLHAPFTAASAGPAESQLDTVIIDLSAEGRFQNTGAWLDEIEERADFRFWTLCNWSARDESGAVRIEAQAALVVLKRPEPAENLVSTGLSE
jgi:hypothetical protein